MTTRTLFASFCAIFALAGNATAGVFADNPELVPGSELKLIIDPGPDAVTDGQAEVKQLALLDCDGGADHVYSVNEPLELDKAMEFKVPAGSWCGVEVAFDDLIELHGDDELGPFTLSWDVPAADLESDSFVNGEAPLLGSAGPVPVTVFAKVEA